MPLRLRAAPVAGLLLFAVAVLLDAGPAWSAAFTDAAGRHVVLPERISRIVPADRDAEVLAYVLARDKLVLGAQPQLSADGMAAVARGARADLILDAGPVTPERAAFANAVQQRSGIPYVLVDDSFDRIPAVLHTIGTVLGMRERGDELRLFAENAISGMRGRLLIRPAEARPYVYYGLGPDGLTTALPGSPAAAAIDEAGANNVAAPLGRGGLVRVSREQLLAWDPEMIIAGDRRFYNALRRDRAWRRLSAVRGKKVYLEPSRPFGWIENPTGVNRVIGLYWLSTLFYPDVTQEELRGITCEFYDKFYRTRLTNAQLDGMVVPAGAPVQQVTQPPGEPLVGPGVTPPPAPPPEVPGLQPIVPGMATGPKAPCTIPGIASPIMGIITGPGPLPGVPGGRRQPGAIPPPASPATPPQ